VDLFGGQNGTGAGFLRVLRFPLAIIPSISPSSRGWHNRPLSGRSADWTQLDSTPPLYQLKKLLDFIQYLVILNVFFKDIFITYTLPLLAELCLVSASYWLLYYLPFNPDDGATYSSETSIYFQRTTRSYIPEDRIRHNHEGVYLLACDLLCSSLNVSEECTASIFTVEYILGEKGVISRLSCFILLCHWFPIWDLDRSQALGDSE
jgi:hypothetical protein